MDERRATEDLRELIVRQLQLASGPGSVGSCNAVLPPDMIVGMHADFETLVGYGAHQRSTAPADMRAWQECSVEQGAHPVMLDDGGAADLAEKPGPECALDGASSLIRSKTEEKSSPDV